MFEVKFSRAAYTVTGTASKTFSTIGEMRDWMRSHFFSKTYHVAGPERQITTDGNFHIGNLVKGA